MGERSLEHNLKSHAAQKCYRQRIDALLPDLQGPLTLENAAQLCHTLSPTPQIHFDQSVSLILPLKQYNYDQCLLIYENSIALIARHATDISQTILSHYHHLEHQVYKETMNEILTQLTLTGHYKTPIATSEYSLFPLTNAKSPETIWLNPASVKQISTVSHQTIVRLFSNISFCSPIEPRSLKANMHISFMTHGIMKRDFTTTVVYEDLSLYEYLHLPYSKEITQAIKNINYTDIPGKRGSLIRHYISLSNQHDKK